MKIFFKAGLMCLGGLTMLSAAAHAEPPRIGSVAVYSDGSVERLIARDGRQSTWQDERLRRVTRDQNPLLPALLREQHLGGADFRQQLRSGKPDSLLTARPGDSVEFSVWRWDGLGNREVAPRDFDCVFQGEQRRQVLGRDDTLQRFACERFTTHHKLWTRKIRERYVIDYSPRLQLAVQVQRDRKGKRSQRSLVALLGPKKYRYAALAQQLNSLQEAK